MKYLKISNVGLLEPEALTLVGASTKRGNENTIGQFGSGNKYALAFLLRNDYEVNIYTGESQIDIALKEKTFRDQDFKILHIDGQPTSITTEMGKNWKLWEALRELYCNALDEGEAKMELTNEVEPEIGYTQFYIRANTAIREFVGNFNKYFSEGKKVLFECKFGKILEKELDEETACIYRRGVRCYDTKKKSAFDYDFNDLKINESREVKYSWKIPQKIWSLLKRCESKEVIERILRAASEDDYIEAEMGDSLTDLSSGNMSEHFKEVVRGTKMAPKEYGGMLPPDEQHTHLLIPNRVYKKVEQYLDENTTSKRFNKSSNGMYKEVEMKPLWEETLRQAESFFNEVDYEISYEIVPVIFDKKSTLGSVKGEKILISDTCFERGVNELINTIIEEHIHIKHGVKDETRAMQTAIISEFITYMKNKNAYAV